VFFPEFLGNGDLAFDRDFHEKVIPSEVILVKVGGLK